MSNFDGIESDLFAAIKGLKRINSKPSTEAERDEAFNEVLRHSLRGVFQLGREIERVADAAEELNRNGIEVRNL